MSKIAGFCAVVLLVSFAAIPARADCPGGYCDDGTILPGSQAEQAERERAAKRERYEACLEACSDTQEACKDQCLRKARQGGDERAWGIRSRSLMAGGGPAKTKRLRDKRGMICAIELRLLTCSPGADRPPDLLAIAEWPVLALLRPAAMPALLPLPGYSGHQAS